MELKKYIEATSKVIIPSIDHLQLIEYKDKELDFAYGLQEHHTSCLLYTSDAADE